MRYGPLGVDIRGPHCLYTEAMIRKSVPSGRTVNGGIVEHRSFSKYSRARSVIIAAITRFVDGDASPIAGPGDDAAGGLRP